MKNNCRYFNTKEKEKKVYLAVVGVIAVLLVVMLVWNMAEADGTVECWVMCKPGTQVYARRGPDKGSAVVGWLDAGDSFRTDAESKDGWIHAIGIGENGEAWIYVGYVVTEEPQKVFEQYCCVAPKRAAVRKWIGGPQVSGRKWLNNGEDVQVFLMADGWAVTNLGYMQSEWLEADPE